MDEKKNCFEKKTGTTFFILSIYNKVMVCALLQTYIYKKSGRAFAYPQARESKPYTHNRKHPPHIARSIHLFHVRI